MPSTTLLNLGTNYIDDLRARLHKAEISFGCVAREMEISVTQFSRWMNKRVIPRIDSIQAIETAIVRIQTRNRKRSGKRA
jgi:hypothetical protein